MLEMDGVKTKGSTESWFLRCLGSMFGKYCSPRVRQEFLAEFNRVDSPFRGVLVEYVLPYFRDVTTDDFSDNAISYLIADLERRQGGYVAEGHVLGYTATDSLVVERLLPLLSEASTSLAENLQLVIKQAGERLGRRYATGLPE